MHKKGKKIFFSFSVAAFFYALYFTVLNWDSPWPQQFLTVDGNSYLKNALGATWTTLFQLEDTYHSPGYSLYLRILFCMFGTIIRVVHVSKILSLFMFAASAILVYRLAHRWFQETTALLALALFSICESWIYYCNMIQYEVLTGFILLVFLSVLAWDEETKLQKKSYLRSIFAGLLLATLVILQVRYIILIPLPFLHSFITRKKIRFAALSLLTAFIPIFTLSILESIQHQQIIFLMTGTALRFKIAYNAGALGYSFPYPPILEPTGIAFILQMPKRFLWLFEQRFLYATGIKQDMWMITLNPLNSIGGISYYNIIGLILFFLGLGYLLFGIQKKIVPQGALLLVFTTAAFFLPSLLFFGSERFLVPIMPLITVVQAYAMAKLITGTYRSAG